MNVLPVANNVSKEVYNNLDEKYIFNNVQIINRDSNRDSNIDRNVIIYDNIVKKIIINIMISIILLIIIFIILSFCYIAINKNNINNKTII